MANNYPIVFSDLKAKVGIDDVAHYLGYAIDKKAGVGRYKEMVLGDPRNPSDRIVIQNNPDKSRQFFFRRDGSKGDVVTFIRENLHSFNVEGNNEWTKIANALSKLANQPIQNDYRQTSYDTSFTRQFEPTRYQTASVASVSFPWILKKRGISPDTVAAMGDKVVLIRDSNNTKFDGYNIGFPYTRPDNDSLAGYEIRGSNGYKSKAAGTDSANSAWIVDFPKDCPQLSRNVFFFESSYDAMAFYQLNRTRLSSSPFSLVSVGGSFNPSLVEQIMKRYPVAKAWDCFDNDLAGQIYSATLVKVIDRIDFSVIQTDGIVSLKKGERLLQCPKEDFDFKKSAIELGIKYSVGHWKSPSNYKDWNDCLMGITITPRISPSKYNRDESLLRQRKSSMKL